MSAPELVADGKEFLRLMSQCEGIIDTGNRLPEFVFRRPFARYFAVEYAHVYRQRFGALLREMSVTFGDDSVSYLALDPRDEYVADSCFFGLISFASSTLPNRYAEVMNPKIGCSKILAGANLGVFWGSSLKWGIFADRISWELAVVATQGDVDVSAILGWPCFNAAQVTSYMTTQYHSKDPSDSIATEFSRRFLANYSV
jgi:hypothetical protein